MSIKISKPAVEDSLMHNAHGTTFPVLAIKFEKSTKLQNFEVIVKIDPKLYDLLTRVLAQDSLFLFANREGQIGIWTSDMNIAISILQDLKVMSSTGSWMINARNALASNLAGSQVESSKKDRKALPILKEVLKAAGLLEEVDSNKYLFGIARDVVSSRKKDPDTIIYRLAMAIYHSQPNSGKAAVAGVEEPSKAYLNLVSDAGFVAKYQESIINRYAKFETDERIYSFKTLLAFLVGAYLYYSVTSG